MRSGEHPFHVLGITAQSSRREILERVEALSIDLDPEKVSDYGRQVTHPVKRLDVEVSWFPGLAPSGIRRLIDIVTQDSMPPVECEEKLWGVDCLWTFNALADWLAEHEDAGPAAWETAIHRLSAMFQSIRTGELMDALNADRSAAGMPQISDTTAVDSALRQHGENTSAFLSDLLARRPWHVQVVTQVVERDTSDGESQASDFIGRIVDRYQILIQQELGRQDDWLAGRCGKLLTIAQNSLAQKRSSNARMTRAIVELEQAVSRWGELARPVQLLMKSRGLKDLRSIEIGKRVRGIAVKLANDFDLHEEAWRITESLYGAFKEVPELVELLDQDFETLREFIGANVRERDEQKGQAELDFGSERHCTECATAIPSVPTSPAGDAPAPQPSATTETELNLSKANMLKALEIFRNEGEEGLQKFLEELYSSESERPVPGASDSAANAETFVQLCRSIRKECWQKIDAKDGHRDRNLAALEVAYRDYQRFVSPWLAIICDACRGDTPVVMKARNAAAECLSSLTGGFIRVNDFDAAQKLCLEALPLVFDDEKLAARIKGQLDSIASEKRMAPQPAPCPTPKIPSPQPEKPATGKVRKPRRIVLRIRVGKLRRSEKPAGGNRVPQSQSAASPLFSSIGNTGGWVRVAAVAIALVVAIPLIVLSVTGPQWQPQVPGGPIVQDPPKAPSVSPPVPPRDPAQEFVRLPNGTNLMFPRHSGGRGTLKISNYTEQDAAVKLKTWTGRTVRFVYVRAMSDVTGGKISPGEYKVQFAAGRDWDTSQLAFRKDREFATFGEVLSFTDDGKLYSTYEITLHAVPNGNVQRKAISSRNFWMISELQEANRPHHFRSHPRHHSVFSSTSASQQRSIMCASNRSTPSRVTSDGTSTSAAKRS